MEKGQKYTIEIEDLSTEGQGIGRADGLVVFVPGTVPGDVAQVELTKVKKSYAFGKLLEITSYSEGRNDEFDCPYMDKCGGCPYGKLDYEAQLELKQKQVRSKLERLAGIDFSCGDALEQGTLENPKLQPIIGMEYEDNYDQGPFRYRNKATMPVSTGGLMTRKGGIQEPVHEPRIGFRPAKSHKVIDCEDCYLQAIPAMAAADALRQFMEEDHICSYDERWNKGLMKKLTVKTAFGTGEVMVILDINGKGIPNVAKLVEMLDDAIYEATLDENGKVLYSLESVIIRYEKKNDKTGKVSGTESIVIAGKPTITDVLAACDADGTDLFKPLAFEISADSFYQVNRTQMIRLYTKVREYAFGEGYASDAKANALQCDVADKKNDTGITDAKILTDGCKDVEYTSDGRKPIVLDLYCGIGTIGLFLADRAEHVHGIEIVKQAVLDANRNAVINGIVNATYTCGKAEEAELPEADIVILDPPRAGCKSELLEAAACTGAAKIIYVSCDPATLARDVKLLAGKCYGLVEATPVDMFPHSGHTEIVALLRRQDEV